MAAHTDIFAGRLSALTLSGAGISRCECPLSSGKQDTLTLPCSCRQFPAAPEIIPCSWPGNCEGTLRALPTNLASPTCQEAE